MSPPELLLGPVVRHLGVDEAILWMETDRACRVEVLGAHERTFCVGGHHYALVRATGLEPGATIEYDVRLDGEAVWPLPGEPPSVLRLWHEGRPFRVLLASCRQVAPHEPPWNETGSDEREIGPDVLLAWAQAVERGDRPMPDALVLLGDQVYADEQNAATVEMLERRRGGPPRPGWPQVTSFEEYTWLYHEAWGDPRIRWLLSCVPSAMIFDDHDILDDWNTSAAWHRQVERLEWWDERITSGLAAYWLYQHIGNADTMDDADVRLLEAVRAAEDGLDVLLPFARDADAGTTGTEGHRWSYERRLGPCQLLMIDSRNGRVLHEGERSMIDEDEWAFVERSLGQPCDHVLIGTSLPWLLPRALHALEAWDERLAGGAWGRGPAARFGEWLRQRIDLEHWAAFGRSFDRLLALLGATARGEHGPAPSTVLVLSGDVHFSYVAELDLPGAASRVHQVVSSPVRHANPLGELVAQRIAMRKPVALAIGGLLRLAGGRMPSPSWDLRCGPVFENNVVLLTFDGPQAEAVVLGAATDGDAPELCERARSPL